MEAELLVRARGYAGFSFAQLADAVGIRKASIHHYFPTKHDLAIALVAAYDARYDTALAAIKSAGTDGIARIEAYGELYLQGVEQRLGCLCAVLAIEIDNLPEPLQADIRRFFGKHASWLESVLIEGQANGTIAAIADPSAAAHMIIATLEGALMMERLMDGAAGFRNVLEALKDSFRPR